MPRVIHPLHSAEATGPLGQLLFRRSGSRQLVTRIPGHTWPRTARSSKVRADHHTTAQLWQQLTPEQLQSWTSRTIGELTGYHLFVSCNDRLASIGLAPLLTLPELPAPDQPYECMAVYWDYPPWQVGGYVLSSGEVGFYALVRVAYSTWSRSKIHRSKLATFAVRDPFADPLTWEVPAWAKTVTIETSAIDARTGLLADYAYEITPGWWGHQTNPVITTLRRRDYELA